MSKKDEIKFQDDYKYGFKDKDVSILNTGVGSSETLSDKYLRLNEPEWMLEFRLKTSHFINAAFLVLVLI